MLAFCCGAGDEVGGHLRLLDGISFLFYFFVWDEKMVMPDDSPM